MPTGAAHRFSDTSPPEGGNLTADNINSLDPGLNVYVSPNGGLNVRVTAGVIWRVFAGAATRQDNAGQPSSDLAVDPSATSYIYLGPTGTVTKGSEWPSTPHLPLAEVVCSGSAITSITDKRPRAVLFAEGGPGGPPAAYTAGIYYGPEQAGDTTQALTLDTLYLIRVDVLRQVTVDRLAAEVTTNVGATNARIGIYPEGSTPDSPAGATLLSDGGTFSVATTGVKEVTLGASIVLQPGRYFIALVSGSTSVVWRAVTAARHAKHGIPAASFATARTLWNGGAQNEGTALPATCPAVTIETINAPVVAFRAA